MPRKSNGAATPARTYSRPRSYRRATVESAPVETPPQAAPRRKPPVRARWKETQVGFKTSTHVAYLLEALQAHYGMSKGSLLEMLVRDRARELRLEPPPRF